MQLLDDKNNENPDFSEGFGDGGMVESLLYFIFFFFLLM
jgi:hypothetical protein